MEELFTRTSVSIDEAVGILIGWLRGPFDAEVYIDENTDETESSVFDLAETLGDKGEFLESEYAEAHHDESPPEVIAQKLEALKSHRTRCDKAKKYLCDIKDELNKGESSALRIDKECPYAMRHITLSSLNEWSTTKYSIDVLTPGRLPVSIQEARAKEKEESVTKGVDKESTDAEVAASKQNAPAAPTVPWLIADERDPKADQPWYTPARYFARQLVREKPNLLANRYLLAKSVVSSLNGVGIRKRGGKKSFDPGTVKKAFVNVVFS